MPRYENGLLFDMEEYEAKVRRWYEENMEQGRSDGVGHPPSPPTRPHTTPSDVVMRPTPITMVSEDRFAA